MERRSPAPKPINVGSVVCDLCLVNENEELPFSKHFKHLQMAAQRSHQGAIDQELLADASDGS